jgi:hypothetical protein
MGIMMSRRRQKLKTSKAKKVRDEPKKPEDEKVKKHGSKRQAKV